MGNINYRAKICIYAAESRGELNAKNQLLIQIYGQPWIPLINNAVQNLPCCDHTEPAKTRSRWMCVKSQSLSTYSLSKVIRLWGTSYTSWIREKERETTALHHTTTHTHLYSSWPAVSKMSCQRLYSWQHNARVMVSDVTDHGATNFYMFRNCLHDLKHMQRCSPVLAATSLHHGYVQQMYINTPLLGLWNVCMSHLILGISTVIWLWAMRNHVHEQ